MNIRDLKYLLAVADQKHFGKAAAASFVSQPTLSMQLKKLEEELGVTLFERDHKQVLVTPIGEQLIAQARVVLREVDQLKLIAQQAKDPFAGEFRLGIIPTIGPYLLPLMLPLVTKRYPLLQLVITENKTDVIVEKLKQGDLDAIILALPIEEPNLVSRHLYKEPFYLALPCDHSLVKKNKITLSDLKNADLLLLEEGHCLRDQALEVCQSIGLQEKRGYQATSLETIRHMVAANLGITLLPELAITQSASNPNIVTKKLADKPCPSRQIGMLWRKNSACQACCEAIAAVVLDIAST